MAEAQIVSQVQERCKVAYAGPHPLIPPATYRVWVGSETAVHLRPRQVGLLLEPHQALREVLGEVVCSSAVVSALSRHGRQSLSRTAAIPSATGCPSGQPWGAQANPFSRRPRTLDAPRPGEAAVLPRPSPYAGFSCCPERQAQSTRPVYPSGPETSIERRDYWPGPLTLNSSRLDSILPSSVQMAPSSVQSVVAGRVTVTSAAESGVTVELGLRARRTPARRVERRRVPSCRPPPQVHGPVCRAPCECLPRTFGMSGTYRRR